MGKEFIINEIGLGRFLSEGDYTNVKILELDTGEYLLHSTQALNTLYFVIEGNLQIRLTSKNGKNLNFSFLKESDCIGIYKLLFSDDENNNFSSLEYYDVVAITDKTKILSIPFSILNELILEDKFRLFLLEFFSKTTYKALYNLAVLHFKGIRSYICYILHHSKNNELKFKTINNLSSMLGIDRKSFFTTINNLEKEKIIERKKEKIVVKENDKITQKTINKIIVLDKEKLVDCIL